LLEGTISEADLIRLDAELSVDPEARRAYYQHVSLDYLLRKESKESVDAARASSEHRTPKPERRVSRVAMVQGILLGLAGSLLVGVGFYAWKPELNAKQTLLADGEARRPVVAGFAVLRGQSDAKWSDAGITVGEFIPQGLVELKQGRAHLEFLSGAQMVIEGHSRFEIESPMVMTMQSGRARAHVPEAAQGFSIRTRDGEIVDLGTEFAIDVSKGSSKVHVIDGEVELHSEKSVERVGVGEAKSLSQDAGIQDAAMEGLEFVGPKDFRAFAMTRKRERLKAWQSSLDGLREDPRLVSYFSFSRYETETGEVANLATRQSGRAGQGLVVAAEQAHDRWGRPGRALDFGRIGSSVRLRVPGELNGLTLNCWVEIDSLDRWYNSLFLTDGHDDFEPHWQILDDGRVFFSVKLPTREGLTGPESQQVFYSPSIKEATTSGKWIMLSVTYDVDAKIVRHFLNGNVISTEAIPAQSVVERIRIGSASICNWSDAVYRTKQEWVLRNLNGSMDEFLLFEGALSPNEISELFQLGTPNG
ncbi:MAG: LamG-like jellyroll fold domain-containing protein, partial [Planctomycetota bacterium]